MYLLSCYTKCDCGACKYSIMGFTNINCITNNLPRHRPFPGTLKYQIKDFKWYRQLYGGKSIYTCIVIKYIGFSFRLSKVEPQIVQITFWEFCHTILNDSDGVSLIRGRNRPEWLGGHQHGLGLLGGAFQWSAAGRQYRWWTAWGQGKILMVL